MPRLPDSSQSRSRMRIALALQIAGCVALIVGCALVAPWLGFVVAGVCGLAFGVALERGL
jgi:hypothetical protein